MQWIAAYGKTATCCMRASQDEIEANPDRFDCQTCELRQRRAGLWQENAEAWQIYQLLCGRTVQVCELQATALEWVTARWSPEERIALLYRLDVILDVLQPEADGRAGTQKTQDQRPG